MRALGDKQKETIRPEFDRSISIDFQGAKITSDTGFLLMREINQRFYVLSAAASKIDDPRSPRHTDHFRSAHRPDRDFHIWQVLILG